MKRKWEKEHHELEETKRILKESGVNVAQCLANLPDRSGIANQQPAGGPVSKRRASFPAAPFRRISLKPPPLVISNSRVLEPLVAQDQVSVSVTNVAIVEEREDATDSDHPPLSASSIKTGAHHEETSSPSPPPITSAHLPTIQSTQPSSTLPAT
jgi:hypothetical protein